MAQFKQDMPPAGGFQPIRWQKVVPKNFLGSGLIVGGTLLCGLISWTAYAKVRKNYVCQVIEERSALFALMPLLAAEKDRLLLRQVRRNRDVEGELMKDVPDWTVGTLHGEPVFYTLDVDQFFQPAYDEIFVHTRKIYKSEQRKQSFLM